MNYKLPATGSVRAVYFSLACTPKNQDLDCVTGLCNVFKESKETAFVSIFSLTEPSIIDTMIKCHRTGLEIEVIEDYSQAQGKTASKEKSRLEDEGIKVHLIKKSNSLMHNKVGIFDMQTVATGSFNWTKNAHLRNRENLIIIDGRDVAQKYYEYCFKGILSNQTE